MFTNSRMDKEDVVHVYNMYTCIQHVYNNAMGYYSALKWNEIMPFAEMCRDLETVMLNEVRKRKRNIIY